MLGQGAYRLAATVSSVPGSWSSPSDIASADVSDSDNQIAIDENGRAFAVWPLADSAANINALVAYVVRTASGNDRVYAHVLE